MAKIEGAIVLFIVCVIASGFAYLAYLDNEDDGFVQEGQTDGSVYADFLLACTENARINRAGTSDTSLPILERVEEEIQLRKKERYRCINRYLILTGRER